MSGLTKAGGKLFKWFTESKHSRKKKEFENAAALVKGDVVWGMQVWKLHLLCTNIVVL